MRERVKLESVVWENSSVLSDTQNPVKASDQLKDGVLGVLEVTPLMDDGVERIWPPQTQTGIKVGKILPSDQERQRLTRKALFLAFLSRNAIRVVDPYALYSTSTTAGLYCRSWCYRWINTSIYSIAMYTCFAAAACANASLRLPFLLPTSSIQDSHRIVEI